MAFILYPCFNWLPDVKLKKVQPGKKLTMEASYEHFCMGRNSDMTKHSTSGDAGCL